MKRLKVLGGMEMDHLCFSDSDYVISQIEKSVGESPMNFRVVYTLGQLNADVAFRISVNDKTKTNSGKALNYITASEIAYQRAIDLSPRNVLAYWGLSRALIYKGFILNDTGVHKSALALAEQAVIIKPGIFASHDLVVDIAANLVGDRDLALKKVAEAVLVDARWKGKLNSHIRNVRAGSITEM